MTRFTDGRACITIDMQATLPGGEERAHCERDVFACWSLPFDALEGCYIVDDVRRLFRAAVEWYDGSGVFADEGRPDAISKSLEYHYIR